MNEVEWWSCSDPKKMLEFLRGKASDRKWRLFACACCRSLQRDLRPDFRVRHAIAISEDYADGLVNQHALEIGTRHLAAARNDTLGRAANVPYTPDAAKSQEEKELDALEWVEWAVAKPEREFWIAETEEEREQQCTLLRDIFGIMPFRPINLQAEVLTWNNGNVVELARSIYEGRSFDRLISLADALEESGCTSADIVTHLRGPGPHVRGCWVLDLILRKE